MMIMNEDVFYTYIKNSRLAKQIKLLVQYTKESSLDEFEKCKEENIILEYSPELFEIINKLLFKENNLLIIASEKYFEDIYKFSNKFYFFYVILTDNYKTEKLYLNINIFKNWCDKHSQYKKNIRELEDKIFDVAFATTDLMEKNEEMEDLISKDGLTKLYNHSFFKERLAEEFSKSKRHNNIFTLAIMDLDFFKAVNDRFGHLKGDEVLKKFAQCIKRNIRKSDFAARYGGEEFAIIFPETEQNKAKVVVSRILKEFSSIKFSSHTASNDQTIDDKNGNGFSVTFSAGLASYSDKYEAAEEMLLAADNALYKSKKTGRNRITTA